MRGIAERLFFFVFLLFYLSAERWPANKKGMGCEFLAGQGVRPGEMKTKTESVF